MGDGPSLGPSSHISAVLSLLSRPASWVVYSVPTGTLPHILRLRGTPTHVLLVGHCMEGPRPTLCPVPNPLPPTRRLLLRIGSPWLTCPVQSIAAKLCPTDLHHHTSPTPTARLAPCFITTPRASARQTSHALPALTFQQSLALSASHAFASSCLWRHDQTPGHSFDLRRLPSIHLNILQLQPADGCLTLIQTFQPDRLYSPSQ